MQKNKFKHLIGMDFESWMVLDKVSGKKLNDSQRIKLDSGNTLKALDQILESLKKTNQKITFFVVFRLEELYPGTIKKILDHGHEVGWHGYSHAPIKNKEILLSELKRSQNLLKKYRINGFQAPYIIFFKEGYKILKQYGFEYSSSIYGNSSKIYNIDGILEIPVSVSHDSFDPKQDEIIYPSHMSISNLLKFGIPFGSSYFWSIFKKTYYEKKLNSATKNKKVVNLFIHNWQLYHKHQKPLGSSIITFLKNPPFFPYTINVKDHFEYLLQNHSFQKFEDYIKLR